MAERPQNPTNSAVHTLSLRTKLLWASQNSLYVLRVLILERQKVFCDGGELTDPADLKTRERCDGEIVSVKFGEIFVELLRKTSN